MLAPAVWASANGGAKVFYSGQLVRRRQHQIGESFFTVVSADSARFVARSPAEGVNEFRTEDFELVPIAPGMRCHVRGSKTDLSVEAVVRASDGQRSLRLLESRGGRRTVGESEVIDL